MAKILIVDDDPTNRSLLVTLLGHRGHRTLEAVPASQREAELLQVDIGAPLMLLDSVSYLDDGTPIEYYHALHRGDRSRFEAELVRVYEPAR